MILKVSTKEDNWVFIDKVDRLNTLGIYEIDDEQNILFDNGKIFEVDFQYTNFGWRTITKEKGKAGEKACLVVSVKTNEGNTYDEKLIAFRGSAYLLNDDGKTIESL